MKRSLVASVIVSAANFALAGTDTFDGASPGSPRDWMCGVTGRGSPVWMIESDPSAPSQPNVLKQSGAGAFPWCVKKDVSIADG